MPDKLALDLPVLLPDAIDGRDRCVDRLIASLDRQPGLDEVHVVAATETDPARLVPALRPDGDGTRRDPRVGGVGRGAPHRALPARVLAAAVSPVGAPGGGDRARAAGTAGRRRADDRRVDGPSRGRHRPRGRPACWWTRRDGSGSTSAAWSTTTTTTTGTTTIITTVVGSSCSARSPPRCSGWWARRSSSPATRCTGWRRDASSPRSGSPAGSWPGKRSRSSAPARSRSTS